jgi:hypothetical protein
MRRTTAVMGLLVLFSAGGGAQSAPMPVPVGVWGGQGIQLTVTATGATIDYGCDSGTIDGRMTTDSSGKIASGGTHSFGSGGPRRAGDPRPKQHKARYEGSRNGDALQLTVFLPVLGRKLGEFSLQLGRRPTLERCG